MQLSRDDVVDRVPPRFESQADRLVYLLAEYKYGAYLAGISFVVLVASGRLGLPALPPWWETVLEGVMIGAIPAALLAKVAIIDPWIPDPRHDVLVLEGENGLLPEAKKVPKNLWERRRSGDFRAWSPPGDHFDFVVTRFEYLEDVGELVVEGCNPEIVQPLSIAARDGMLEEIFGDLQYRAAELDRYKSRERSRRIEYDRKHVNALMAAVEHGLEFEPGTLEAIQEEDEDDLERLDQDVDRSDEQPTLSELENQQVAATDGGIEDR